MLFAPTTARSFSVRVLYAVIYGLLGLGAITMIVPFLIMLSGSVEPSAEAGAVQLFPRYLVDDGTLWERYIEVKYQGVTDYLRMAWNDPDVNFQDPPSAASSPADAEQTARWRRFVREENPPEKLFTPGFLRPNPRMPAYTAFLFRDWLAARYGAFANIKAALGFTVSRPAQIEPPRIRMDGPPLPDSPLARDFLAFSTTLPLAEKFAWDAGNYYRTSILPRLFGPDVGAYNARFGVHYASYADVPFPATMPETGAQPWILYVTRLLRTDFIQLSAEGSQRAARLGLSKDQFIRTEAQPDELRVESADTLFAAWAARKGIPEARIPQLAMDREAFVREKSVWRWRFVTLNFRAVLEEILGRSGAVRNTLILVVLSVAGALVVNPLAAYALSRYRMKSSYYILLFCLATIAFPAEVTMIPVFLQLKEFHLLNTFGALVLPGLANGFSIFLLKGFFDSLPRELYEAAELDGAGEWITFWNITMYLSKPILAVIALQAFVTAYGAFFYALILAPDPGMWTLMVYIYQLRQNMATPVVYASLLITAIPTLIVFVTCQNVILRGIVVPSEK